MKNLVAEALEATLISSNELDSNLEPANVVDGLFMIARGLHAVADAIKHRPDNPDFDSLTDAVNSIADAIAGRVDDHAEAP